MNSAMDRFMSKVLKTDYCWIYTGRTDNGYGRFWYMGKGVLAHRWIYENSVSSIPEKMQIDHICRNRSCVRIDHLEVVSNNEQQKRKSIAQTHCKHGHEYTKENTYIYKNKRNCIKCRKNSNKKFELKRIEEKS
jgi:hypothetical protein